MSAPKKNPMIPAQLAGGRDHGAGDNALGAGHVKHTRPEDGALWGAACALAVASAGLERLALVTDWPPEGVPEAADLLDAARVKLAGALS